MTKAYKSIEELIGNTPLLQLNKIVENLNLNTKLFAKLEGYNLTGSIKDRTALSMINEAEKEGLLVKGSTIIEPTSGNTGIGLACIGVNRGYRVILVMPETMSLERRKLIKAYGAEIVLTEGSKGMQGAIDKAKELNEEINNSFIPSQFTNFANPKIHYHTTGKEIYEDTDGKVDILVAAVGTGGTITGIGKYLKEKNPNIQIVAVEPDNSPVLSGGSPSAHKIQGIGAGFIPEVLNTNIYDRVIRVKDEDALKMGNYISKTEGILVGISSGAALWASIQLSKEEENKDKMIVVIFPDSGDRYLSSEMFEE